MNTATVSRGFAVFLVWVSGLPYLLIAVGSGDVYFLLFSVTLLFVCDLLSGHAVEARLELVSSSDSPTSRQPNRLRYQFSAMPALR